MGKIAIIYFLRISSVKNCAPNNLLPYGSNRWFKLITSLKTRYIFKKFIFADFVDSDWKNGLSKY